MKTSENGIELIKDFEGFSPLPYDDVAGKPTIGFGHLIKSGEGFISISEEEGIELLEKDLQYFEKIINDNVTKPLTQNQFDALVSFVFNVGPGKYGAKDGFLMLKNGNESTMLRKINAGDYQGTAEEFLKWNKAGGVEVAGLTKRRSREKQLFLTA